MSAHEQEFLDYVQSRGQVETSDWMPDDYRAKLIKFIEMHGHSQLIYRVGEDLGKPREQCLEDLISGKSKFHNVFHYPTKTWGDVGVIAWLVDAAAIISQKAL